MDTPVLLTAHMGHHKVILAATGIVPHSGFTHVPFSAQWVGVHLPQGSEGTVISWQS